MRESKKVMVTGSSGFVAGHTIPELKSIGYDVITYDLVDGQDICNADQLRESMPNGCKVLHLAAVSRFAHAEEDPPEAYRTNVGGTATLLKVAGEVGAERVVMASTASVYMPAWNPPIRENHPVSGNSHYGYSKLHAETMLQLHRDVPYVVLRYAHLYGLNKAHGGLIDAFLTRIARGAAPLLFGGEQSNDFTYIDDVVQANIQALDTPYTNEIYNVGTGQAVTTKEAFDLLKSATKYDGPVEHYPMRTVDSKRFVLDINKSKRQLGYFPEWTFRDGLLDLLSKMEKLKDE